MVGIENAEIAVPLECFSNFWRTLEMDLINWKFNLIFRWLPTCVISEGNRAIICAITGTKLYTPIYHQGITQSYCSNLNQVLKEQWTEINITQKY